MIKKLTYSIQINQPAMVVFSILLYFMLISTTAMAYEKLYAVTPAGTIEVKTIPARTALQATDAGSYFAKDNNLFRRLFNYISDNKVAMTVPVEAEINPARMVFFVGQSDSTKPLTDDNNGVKVKKLPARQVVALGYNGSYSQNNFLQHKQKLEQWLKGQENYSANGEPYAVYWDGPFTLWFLKRAEVHIPIVPANSE